MKKLLVLLSVLSVGAAFADGNSVATSSAQTGGAYNTGAYADLQFGAANSSGLNSGVDTAGAMRIDAGYKIDSYMGIEAGTTMLTAPSAGAQTAAIQFYDVSFKGTLPISQYFDVHGQLGVAYAQRGVMAVNGGPGTSSTSENIQGLVGVGADVYLTKRFAVTVNDYNYIGGNTNQGGGNTNVVMGGLKYDFE